MNYTKIASILYALALLILILFAAFGGDDNVAKDLENFLWFLFVEFIVLVGAVIFTILASIKKVMKKKES